MYFGRAPDPPVSRISIHTRRRASHTPFIKVDVCHGPDEVKESHSRDGCQTCVLAAQQAVSCSVFSSLFRRRETLKMRFFFHQIIIIIMINRDHTHRGSVLSHSSNGRPGSIIRVPPHSILPLRG